MFDAVLEKMMKKNLRKRDTDIRALLIAGFYQIAYMRTKPHAVVDESVKASRKLGKPAMSGMVNGVLRRFQREQASLLDQAMQNNAASYAYQAGYISNCKLTGTTKHRPFVKRC